MIAKKVGLNREDGTYAGEIKTFEEYGNDNPSEIKQKLKNNKELAKQYYKIQIASALIGSYDSHLSNVMYSKDKNGKETLYPIDFGASCLDMQQLLNFNERQAAANTTKYLAEFKDANQQALKEAIYEVSKVWVEKEKEITEHLKNSCKALGVEDAEYKNLTQVIDANKTFMMKDIKVTKGVYERSVNRTLPSLLMGQHQLQEYERQNNRGQGAAPHK